MKPQRSLPTALALVAGLFLSIASVVRADDWPQWLGPRHDGVWRETSRLDAFPATGVPIRWRTPVGAGYGGPAVAGGKVYLMDHILGADTTRPSNPFKRITLAGAERVHCINAADGKEIWTHAYDCPYTVSYSAGPRAVPAVDDDLVYTMGAEGDLNCLQTMDGKVVWSHKLSSEKDPTPLWGFAGHPLLDGNRLICMTADADGLVAAFDKKTGKKLWSALSGREPGYSTPILCEFAGRRQLIVWVPESVNSLDPETGKVLWSVNHGPAKMGLCIVTPRVYHDPDLGDVLYIATQYEGSLLLKLSANEKGEPTASVLWKRKGKSDRNTDALHILMSTPTLRDGSIFGVDAMGQLRCLELKTGNRLWETAEATTMDAGPQKWSTTFIVPVGESGSQYLLPNEHGDLLLAEMSGAGFKLISKTHVLEPTNTDPGRPVVWSVPALANECIYWRNDKEIVCAQLAGK